MKLAIAMLIAGTTAVSAAPAPYYVGTNLSQPNHLALGFQDTPTKKDPAITNQSGNIAAFELKGNYNFVESFGMRASLPFYMASRDVVGTSRNALGNPNVGLGYTGVIPMEPKTVTLGYAFGLDGYAPTSRKIEGSAVAIANPTTDFYKYYAQATTLHTVAGMWIMHDMFSAKTNAGFGYMYLSKKGARLSQAQNDQHRNTITIQAAGSWHALSNLHVNMEYNSILLDASTLKNPFTTVNGKRWRHALTPSVSGSYNGLLANTYVTIPLDKTTRDSTNVAFGLNAGYTF